MKTPEDLIKIATRVYKSSPLMKSRKLHNIWARRAVFVQMKRKYSVTGIARHFKCNHATVLNSISRHYDLYDSDNEYTEYYDKFLKIVNPKEMKAKSKKSSNVADGQPDPRLLELIKRVPGELAENVAVKLEAIVNMTLAVHNSKK